MSDKRPDPLDEAPAWMIDLLLIGLALPGLFVVVGWLLGFDYSCPYVDGCTFTDPMGW